jgi:hypothetical protein
LSIETRTARSDGREEPVMRQRILAEEPKVVSDRKRKANQKNAKKSTGPKTPRGKSNSRTNAVKHGFFANPSRIWEAGESPRVYKELLEDLWDRWLPVGKVEEALVEKLARLFWKQKRIGRYEDSMTQKALGKAMEFVIEDMFDVSGLETVQEEIERTGKVPPNIKEIVVAGNSLFKSLWESFDETEEEQNSNNSGPTPSEDYVRLHSLAIIKCMHSHLTKLNNRSFFFLKKRAGGENILLPDDAADKILRHEVATDGGIKRTMDQLERVQRERMIRNRRSGAEQAHGEL